MNEDYASMAPTIVKERLFGQPNPNKKQKRDTPAKRKITIYNDNPAMKSHAESMSSSLTT